MDARIPILKGVDLHEKKRHRTPINVNINLKIKVDCKIRSIRVYEGLDKIKIMCSAAIYTANFYIEKK